MTIHKGGHYRQCWSGLVEADGAHQGLSGLVGPSGGNFGQPLRTAVDARARRAVEDESSERESVSIGRPLVVDSRELLSISSLSADLYGDLRAQPGQRADRNRFRSQCAR